MKTSPLRVPFNARCPRTLTSVNCPRTWATGLYDGPVMLMRSAIGPETSVSLGAKANAERIWKIGLASMRSPPRLKLRLGTVERLLMFPFHRKNEILNLKTGIIELEGRLVFLIIEHAFQCNGLQAGKAERHAIRKWTIAGEFLKG